jgi:hypothetical protein
MMAVSTGIFKTPTGPTYDPSRDIERGFDKTAGIITGFMERKAQDFDQQQAAFSEMYSNLGELEAKLQENYSGIQQQMIDSTREWLKEANKSGKRATDPDFQMGLSQRVGRIRAGMANADRNREQLKQAAELIKSDPSILDKGKAFSDLYLKMNDPDFLISKNGFNSSEFLDNYVNPTIVAQNVAGMIKSTGTYSDRLVDPATGKLIEETVNLNEAIDATSPLVRNSDGTTRLNIKPSDNLVKDLMSGNYDPRAPRFINKIAEERYGGIDANTLKLAAADFLSTGMGPNYARKTLMTKEDLDRQKLMDQKTMSQIDLNISSMRKNLENIGKTEKEQTEINDRWDKFISAFSAGDKGILGDYENMKSNVQGFNWVTEKSKYSDVPDTKTGWDALTKEERQKIITSLGVDDLVPSGYFGVGKATDSQQAFDAVRSQIKSLPSNVTGVKFRQKEGRVDGQDVWGEAFYPMSTEDEIVKAFKALENLRTSGAKPKPEPEAGKVPAGAAQTQGFKSVPQGGF